MTAVTATGIDSIWPAFRLRITTERLELRPPGDEEIAALARVAREGVHDPAVMPFGNGWTDRSDAEFGRGFAQYFWSQRARWTTDSWALPFAVFLGGEPVGVQQLTAEGFPVTRTVGTGSWVARSAQGRGIGTEMRAAVLDLAFFGLGADFAISGAYTFNEASIRVSRKLGYEPNGTRLDPVRGQPEEAVLFRLSRSSWEAREHRIARAEGLDDCRELFGIELPARSSTATDGKRAPLRLVVRQHSATDLREVPVVRS